MKPVAGTDSHLVELEVASEDVFKGRLLHIRRDTVQLPGAAGLATREYVVHPGAVMVVPLVTGADGEQLVVLERQFRYPLGRVMIEFPAGKLDPPEDLWFCARRELREETGYSADEWAHAGVLHPLVAYCTEVIDIWFARGLKAGSRQLDHGESLDVVTVPVADLLQWCRDGTVTDGKTLVGALWLQNLLSGAWSLQWQACPAAPAAG